MKKLKQEGNKYTIQFDKIVRTTETFDREFVVNQISKIQSKIDAGLADKAKYEEILNLIDAK
jgi:hypothetical protein